MASWAEFLAQAPEVAIRGEATLFRTPAGESYLTTVAGEGLPRTHPINVGIVDGHLLAFIQGHSAKVKDLSADGRYALHAFQDPATPHEFLLRGRARLVTDPVLRSAAAAVWPFRPKDDYPLFELGIEHALFGERGDANDWPPIYTSWRAKPSG